MNRPSFSNRSAPIHSSQVGISSAAHASDLHSDVSVPEANVAVPAHLAGDDSVALADELAAAFLARTSGIRVPPRESSPLGGAVAEEAMQQPDAAANDEEHLQLASQNGVAVSQAPAGAAPPRFGSARRVSPLPGRGPARAVRDAGSEVALPAPVEGHSPAPETQEAPPADTPRSTVQVEPAAKLAVPAAQGAAEEVSQLARNIQAASVVTKLVAGMAIAPGSDADVSEKSRVLVALMVLARRSAEELVELVDPENADTAWVQSQALGHVAEMISSEWCAGHGDLDVVRNTVDARMALVRAILIDHGGEMEGVLGVATDGIYERPCSDAQSISDHRAVAIHRSAWSLGSAVANVRDSRGDVFSFGMQQEDVVAALLHQAVGVASASRPDLRDANAAVAYLNGALDRATELVSHEYRSRAQEACAWVAGAADEGQRRERLTACPDMFTAKSIPFISQWVAKNFQSIERASRKLIEDQQNENESADRPGR